MIATTEKGSFDYPILVQKVVGILRDYKWVESIHD